MLKNIKIEDKKNIIYSIVTIEVVILMFFYGLSLMTVMIPIITIGVLLKNEIKNINDNYNESSRIFTKEDRTFYNKDFLNEDTDKNINKELLKNMSVLNINSISELNKSQIKKKYILMAKKYHPDLNNVDTKHMIDINRSYEYLVKYIKNQ